MIYILNSKIIPTDFSKKSFIEIMPISVSEAKNLLKKNEFISTIGHEDTAKYLSELFETTIPMNRISVTMTTHDIGIHMMLEERFREGEVLSLENLKKMKISFLKSQVIYSYPLLGL